MGAGIQQTIQVSFGHAAINAGTSEVWEDTILHPGTYKLLAAYYQPMTNRTAHATNYTTLSVELGGTEVATIATTAGGTGNLVAGTPSVITLTGTGKQLEVAQYGRISFKKTDSGAGLALDGKFVALFERVRA